MQHINQNVTNVDVDVDVGKPVHRCMTQAAELGVDHNQRSTHNARLTADERRGRQGMGGLRRVQGAWKPAGYAESVMKDPPTSRAGKVYVCAKYISRCPDRESERGVGLVQPRETILLALANHRHSDRVPAYAAD